MRLLFDENFDNDIVRGLRRHNPDVELIRVQDVGLRSADDPTILEWAANQGCVLFTHDVKTMVDFAYERIRVAKPMPGLFEVNRKLSIGEAIEEILIVAECSLPDEWENQVVYLPLK
jgi:hypothetical protein